MPRSLTTTEAGAMTTPPVSRFTVMREIKRKHLEAEKSGGRWMIELVEAMRWAGSYKPQGPNKAPG
jgi:hypothetical protein